MMCLSKTKQIMSSIIKRGVNNTMMMDLNFLFSLITAVIAIIALFQTNQQIKLSNKQYLFGKRVECYLIAKGLIQLYENNYSLLVDSTNEYIYEIEITFKQLTNNTYLEEITNIIDRCLEQPYQKEFLIKIDALENVSSQIKLIFENKYAILLGDYVLCYQKLLLKMYQYQIFLNNLNKQANNPGITQEDANNKIKESTIWPKLQRAIENLQNAYDILKKENVQKKIEKQIKLI